MSKIQYSVWNIVGTLWMFVVLKKEKNKRKNLDQTSMKFWVYKDDVE